MPAKYAYTAGKQLGSLSIPVAVGIVGTPGVSRAGDPLMRGQASIPKRAHN